MFLVTPDLLATMVVLVMVLVSNLVVETLLVMIVQVVKKDIGMWRIRVVKSVLEALPLPATTMVLALKLLEFVLVKVVMVEQIVIFLARKEPMGVLVLEMDFVMRVLSACVIKMTLWVIGTVQLVKCAIIIIVVRNAHSNALH